MNKKLYVRIDRGRKAIKDVRRKELINNLNIT